MCQKGVRIPPLVTIFPPTSLCMWRIVSSDLSKLRESTRFHWSVETKRGRIECPSRNVIRTRCFDRCRNLSFQFLSVVVPSTFPTNLLNIFRDLKNDNFEIWNILHDIWQHKHLNLLCLLFRLSIWIVYKLLYWKSWLYFETWVLCSTIG